MEVIISKPAAESLILWSFYAIFLMISCLGLVFYLVQTQRIVKSKEIEKEVAEKARVNANNKEELKKKLSETETALRNVITNLTKIISDLKTDMEEQDTSLATQKENISKATTLQDYVKIGDVLVSEITKIITTNKGFKEKLKNAEGIIKEQNDNLAKLVTETMTDHLTTVLNKRGFERGWRRSISDSRDMMESYH